MTPTEKVSCENKACKWSAIMYLEDLCFDGWTHFTDCPQCGMFAFKVEFKDKK